MIVTIPRDTMTRMIRSNCACRGVYMANMGDHWMALKNDTDTPRVFKGLFPEVIDWLVPFNGKNVVLSDIVMGIYRTSDILRRMPMKPWRKRRMRFRKNDDAPQL